MKRSDRNKIKTGTVVIAETRQCPRLCLFGGGKQCVLEEGHGGPHTWVPMNPPKKETTTDDRSESDI